MQAIIIIIVFTVIFLLGFNYVNIKGWFGEKIVSIILKSLPYEYTIFNNVYITKNGKSSQIDHVVFSPYGIFVIETKHYKGWIYGGEKTTYWTKNVYGKKYLFYNPLLQNNAHVKALQSLLEIPQRCFIPIVVFIGSATIKSNYPNYNVVYGHQLLSTIKYYKNILLRNETLDAAIDKLSYSVVKTYNTAKEHRKQVRNNIKNRYAAISQGICPQCGGLLVNRKGKYGVFWGCSNYPRCRYTLKDN